MLVGEGFGLFAKTPAAVPDREPVRSPPLTSQGRAGSVAHLARFPHPTPQVTFPPRVLNDGVSFLPLCFVLQREEVEQALNLQMCSAC